MQNCNFHKIFVFQVLILCSIVYNACAQPHSENITFLTPSSYNRMVINADKVTAVMFEQDARGHTTKQPDNALFGFVVKEEKVIADDYTIKTLRTLLGQANNYDTSGYLPKCGFDPDYGLIFHEGEKTTQVMLMLRKNCNPIKFSEGADVITTKELLKQGRDQLLPVFKGIFQESMGQTYPTVPPATTSPNPPREENAPEQHTAQENSTATQSNNSNSGNNNRSNQANNTPPPIEEYHVIKSNHDTYYSLARKYHTTVEEITKLNPGLDPQKLKKHDKIRVR
ncbi:MAG: LysM peptidoglycan-binding domain-containing protein [Saprospiraceae bacterium]